MLRAYHRHDDRLVAVDIDPEAAPEASNTSIWYSLTNPTRAEDQFVESCLGIEIPTREEMDDIEPSARIYTENGAEFMTFTALVNSDTDEPRKTPISFVLRGNQLVTVRYDDPRSILLFEKMATRSSNTRITNGEQVMIGLLEAVIDRLAQLLETIGDEVDHISREVFRNKTRNVSRKARGLQQILERIGAKGDTISLAQESLVSIARVAAFHQQGEDTASPRSVKEARQQVKILQRDVAALSDHAAFLNNKLSFLLDATLGLISLEQNQIIKIFSVAAVVFLPPTLVASIYGMNFDVMPELSWPWGYPFALGLMILAAVLPYLFFKRKGWL